MHTLRHSSSSSWTMRAQTSNYVEIPTTSICAICCEFVGVEHMLANDVCACPSHAKICVSCVYKSIRTSGTLQCPSCRINFNTTHDKWPRDLLKNLPVDGDANVQPTSIIRTLVRWCPAMILLIGITMTCFAAYGMANDYAKRVRIMTDIRKVIVCCQTAGYDTTDTLDHRYQIDKRKFIKISRPPNRNAFSVCIAKLVPTPMTLLNHPFTVDNC